VSDPVAADGWPGPAWEVVESVKALDARLTTRKTKMFAYPGSAIKEFNNSATWRPEIAKYVAAARGGSGNPINIANQTDYYDIRTTANPPENLTPADPRFVEFDITNILNPNATERCKKYYRGWVTHFIHSVNGGKGWDETPYTRGFVAVFDWVTQHRDEIWIGFLDDVALYGQERDTARLQTRESTEKKITLELTSQMDPEIFNYPLTLKVCVPASWQAGISATQGGKVMDVSAVTHEGRRYVLVKAVPDGGDIAIMPK